MIITLQNETGAVKQVPTGFSWTTFFFGILVPLFRADWKWFFIQLILTFLTLGLSNFFFMFAYNKIYISGLLKLGYKPADNVSINVLQAKGMFLSKHANKVTSHEHEASKTN